MELKFVIPEHGEVVGNLNLAVRLRRRYPPQRTQTKVLYRRCCSAPCSADDIEVGGTTAATKQFAYMEPVKPRTVCDG